MPKLWKHQQQMLFHARSRNHSLIYAGMGTGKTLFGINYLGGFLGLKLVICPKPAMVAWSDDLDRFHPQLEYTMLNKGTSTSKARKVRLLSGDNIIIVNYETARLLPLDQYPFQAVILDEGHRIGRYNSKQTLAITRMLSCVPNKVLMTGTPYNDGYERLYSMVRFFNSSQSKDPREHPRCKTFGHYDNFMDDYCHTFEMSRGVRIINGYKNLDRLATKIKPFTLQIQAKDVLDLPDVVERVYRVPLMGPVKKAYKQLDKESVIEYDGEYLTAPHLLTKIIRLQQLATCGLMVSEDGQEVVFGGIEKRIDTLKMLVEQINEPLVIFTRFKRDVEIIKKALIKYPIHLLTGDVDNHVHWKKGNGKILIANIGAGAEGVRLERARHMIFWSVGHSNTEFEQAKARIIRAGQKSKTCWLHYIVSEGTIDETIYKTLSGKNENKQRLDNML